MAGSPKLTVALDFGTTYSGFAFAHVSDPAAIHTFYDYPSSGREKSYVKTPTTSYYKPRAGAASEWEFKSWGHPARADYERDVLAFRKHRKQQPGGDGAPTVGVYLTKFKLHLAGKASAELPEGLTTEVVIADYLRAMGAVILTHLQRKFGAHFAMAMIQWCVTVPSIWDDAAKATMKACMAAAGLVSPHPLILVLEPEAASFYCHKLMSENRLAVGDKLLVADIGGGTSDIVVQEVVITDRTVHVKEATMSTGGLVGGASVDTRFMEYIYSVIGPCFPECLLNHCNVSNQLLAAWERAKTSFGEPTLRGNSVQIDFPSALAVAWENFDRQRGHPERDFYDGVEIAHHDMPKIFDPVVEEILALIARQVLTTPVKALIVVGGFAGSPYLMECIRERFSATVPHIFSPPNPGSAVSCGAVALAMNPGMVVSRICKRTYGFQVRAAFEEGVDPKEYKVTRKDGVARCRNRFLVLIRKGEEVKVDQAVSQTYNVFREAKRTKVRLYSSGETHPRYTKGKHVKKEGKLYVWDVSGQRERSAARPEMKVSLFFGRSCIEVKVEGVNFVANEQVACQIPVDFLYLTPSDSANSTRNRLNHGFHRGPIATHRFWNMARL